MIQAPNMKPESDRMCRSICNRRKGQLNFPVSMHHDRRLRRTSHIRSPPNSLRKSNTTSKWELAVRTDKCPVWDRMYRSTDIQKSDRRSSQECMSRHRIAHTNHNHSSKCNHCNLNRTHMWRVKRDNMPHFAKSTR
jgi:hypothetical protein